jgi:hypothetical protein
VAPARRRPPDQFSLSPSRGTQVRTSRRRAAAVATLAWWPHGRCRHRRPIGLRLDSRSSSAGGPSAPCWTGPGGKPSRAFFVWSWSAAGPARGSRDWSATQPTPSTDKGPPCWREGAMPTSPVRSTPWPSRSGFCSPGPPRARSSWATRWPLRRTWSIGCAWSRAARVEAHFRRPVCCSTPSAGSSSRPRRRARGNLDRHGVHFLTAYAGV